VAAPSHGRVVTMPVSMGAVVERGQVLATVQPAGEIQPAAPPVELRAPRAGRVIELLVEEGGAVRRGEPLMRLGSTEARLELSLYIDGALTGPIRQGMIVQVSPATASKQQYGFLIGTVRTLGELPVSPQAIVRLTRNERVAEQLLAQGAPVEIAVDLLPDQNTPTGYAWSSSKGPATLPAGVLCSASITVAEQRPISWLFPMIGN